MKSAVAIISRLIVAVFILIPATALATSGAADAFGSFLPNAFAAVVGIALLGVFLALVLSLRGAAKGLERDSQQQVAQSQAQAVEHMKALAFEPIVPVETTQGLHFDGSERPYYSGPAELLGMHTVTRRVGASTGPSFRVAKGVYWRASAFSSRPIRESFVEVDDQGMLVVTNKRVIFVGHSENMALPIARILSTEPYSDGLMLNPERGRSMTFRTGSQDAWFILERARFGSLDQRVAETPRSTEP